MQIDTTSLAYRATLTTLRAARVKIEEEYGPLLRHMTDEQIRELEQRDESFAECLKILKEIG